MIFLTWLESLDKCYRHRKADSQVSCTSRGSTNVIKTQLPTRAVKWEASLRVANITDLGCPKERIGGTRSQAGTLAQVTDLLIESTPWEAAPPLCNLPQTTNLQSAVTRAHFCCHHWPIYTPCTACWFFCYTVGLVVIASVYYSSSFSARNYYNRKVHYFYLENVWIFRLWCVHHWWGTEFHLVTCW